MAHPLYGRDSDDPDLLRRLRMLGVRALFESLAGRLWSVYHKRPQGPHLILPTKRDTSIRVSEQESKILVCQELERSGIHYSIETPTRERYQQSGQGSMSARIDVTLYGSPDPADRTLNLELKAGTAGIEAFRKDFEKLLREATPGGWFHTLERTTPDTWRTLRNNALEALLRVAEHAEVATHSVMFGFCELNDPAVAIFELQFGSGWDLRFATEFDQAVANAIHPDWRADAKGFAVPRRQSEAGRTYGKQRKLLIYCPEIDPETVLHLSIRGESYALRKFSAAGVSRTVREDARNTSSLYEKYRIEEIADVTSERKSLEAERGYWIDRVQRASSARLGRA